MRFLQVASATVALASVVLLLGCSPEKAEDSPATLSLTALADPNLISVEALLALPNVDATLADAIVAGRPYLDAAAFDQALSATLEKPQRQALYGAVFRAINLNSASRAEILLIPGVTDHLAHEFEEYRPYTSLAQFRREIGKYVDDAEVARLERYVTLE